MKECPYRVLGLARTADEALIRKTYRRLALETHPDKNPEGEERFKKIAWAYELLTDKKRRQAHDRQNSFSSTTGPRRSRPPADAFRSHFDVCFENYFVTIPSRMISSMYPIISMFFSLVQPEQWVEKNVENSMKKTVEPMRMIADSRRQFASRPVQVGRMPWPGKRQRRPDWWTGKRLRRKKSKMTAVGFWSKSGKMASSRQNLSMDARCLLCVSSETRRTLSALLPQVFARLLPPVLSSCSFPPLFAFSPA